MRWPWSKPREVRRADARLVRALKARYDAAQTTPQNRRHWEAADLLSADAAASPSVRATLRSRARYEAANNCYARGIVRTLAEDLVGTGPRLQMLSADDRANAAIERGFARWARAVGLAEKLQTMRAALATDGEAFALTTTNPGHRHPVRLDLRLVEADQVATPNWTPSASQPVDGIELDGAGNPAAYHLLEQHPGGPLPRIGGTYRRVPAGAVIHWFRSDRPGQHRGIPELTPALPLFALLRRYTLAVVSAAETAANFAVFMKTTFPPGGEAAGSQDADGGSLAGFQMELERNSAVFTPEGWEPAQIRAEQPATTYPDFKGEIVAEIARCLNIPYNIAALDSRKHNYASGRLDHQLYLRSVRVDQARLERAALDQIFAAWMAEARRLPAVVPPGRWLDEEDPHAWYWRGLEEVDPRWARAKAELVQAGHITEAEYHAERGRDWEEEQAQRQREAASRREKRLPELGPAKAAEVPERREPAYADEGGNGDG